MFEYTISLKWDLILSLFLSLGIALLHKKGPGWAMVVYKTQAKLWKGKIEKEALS